jgi:hypothetical protein
MPNSMKKSRYIQGTLRLTPLSRPQNWKNKVDAPAQLLIEKGLISEQEFYAKLKQVQMEYQARRNGKA